MISAGFVSFHHQEFLSFCRNEPLVFTGLSAKFHCQMNLKMGSRFFRAQVLRRSRQASGPYCRHVNCATSSGNRYQWFPPEDEFDRKPFWLTLVDDIIRSLRSLALFLVEQPSQLKYIEWPSIENTAKTAALTLVLVAVLIVSLASVDSFLFYVLARLSRRSA